jgi:hypothetical protein
MAPLLEWPTYWGKTNKAEETRTRTPLSLTSDSDTLNPHISQNFVARAWRVLLRGCELVKRRSSRIGILQSGVLPIRALAVVLSALAVGIL